MKTATLPTPATTKRRKADRLPPKLERFTAALTRGILAASKAPTGAVNLTDYLDPSQVRMLCRMAEKAGKTPRQFLQSLVDHLTNKSRVSTINAGGAN
ncbi:MAG: hypothetical protein V4689_11760 [Verrucomicrobiota bacterium]